MNEERKLLFCDTFHRQDYGSNEFFNEAVKFRKPVIIKALWVVPNNTKPHPELSSLKVIGLTEPRTFSLHVYAKNLIRRSAQFQSLVKNFNFCEGTNEWFHVSEADEIVTDHIIIRGGYTTLTLCLYGREAPEFIQTNEKKENKTLPSTTSTWDFQSSKEFDLSRLPNIETLLPKLNIENKIRSFEPLTNLLEVGYKLLSDTESEGVFDRFVEMTHTLYELTHSTTSKSNEIETLMQQMLKLPLTRIKWTQKILTKDKVKVVDDLMVSVLFDILKEVLQFSESKETNDEKNEESHYQKPTNKSALETKQCRIFTSLMQVNYSLELITALSKCSLSFSEHFVNCGGFEVLYRLLHSLDCFSQLKSSILKTLKGLILHSESTMKRFLSPRSISSVNSPMFESESGYQLLVRLLLLVPQNIRIVLQVREILFLSHLYESLSNLQKNVDDFLAVNTSEENSNVCEQLLSSFSEILYHLRDSRLQKFSFKMKLPLKLNNNETESSQMMFCDWNVLTKEATKILEMKNFLLLVALVLGNPQLRVLAKRHANEIHRLFEVILQIFFLLLRSRYGLLYLAKNIDMINKLIPLLTGKKSHEKPSPLLISPPLHFCQEFPQCCTVLDLRNLLLYHMEALSFVDTLLSTDNTNNDQIVKVFCDMSTFTRTEIGKHALISMICLVHEAFHKILTLMDPRQQIPAEFLKVQGNEMHTANTTTSTPVKSIAHSNYYNYLICVQYGLNLLAMIFQTEEFILFLERSSVHQLIENAQKIVEDISEQISELNWEVKQRIQQISLCLKPILTVLQEKKLEGLVSGMKQYLTEGIEVKKNVPMTITTLPSSSLTQKIEGSSVTSSIPSPSSSLSATSHSTTQTPLLNLSQSNEKKQTDTSVQQSGFSSSDAISLISTLRFLFVQCNKETCSTMIAENILPTIISILNKAKSFFGFNTTPRQGSDSQSKTKPSVDLQRERETLEVILSSLQLLYAILRILRCTEPEFKNTTLLQTLLSLKIILTNNYLLYTNVTLHLNCHSTNTNIARIIDKYITMIVNLMIGRNWWNFLPTLLEWTYSSPQNQVGGLTLFYDILPEILPLHVTLKYHSVHTLDPYLNELLERVTKDASYFGFRQQRNTVEKYIIELRKMWLKNLTESGLTEEKFDYFVTSFAFSSNKVVFTKFVKVIHKLIDLGGVISLRVVEDLLRVVETEVSLLLEKAQQHQEQQQQQQQQKTVDKLPIRKKETKNKPLLCRLLYLLWSISCHPLGRLALIEKNALAIVLPLINSTMILSQMALRKVVALVLKFIHSLLSPKCVPFEKNKTISKETLSENVDKSKTAEETDKEVVENLPPPIQLQSAIHSLFNLLTVTNDEKIMGTTLLILTHLATCFYGAYQILCSENEERITLNQTLTSQDKDSNTQPSSLSSQQQKRTSSYSHLEESPSIKFSTRALFVKFLQRIQASFSQTVTEATHMNSLWNLIELAIHFLSVVCKVVSEKLETKDYLQLFKNFVVIKDMNTSKNQNKSTGLSDEDHSQVTILHSLFQTLKNHNDERSLLLADRLQFIINNSMSMLPTERNEHSPTNTEIDKSFSVSFPQPEKTISERLSAIENRIIISNKRLTEHFRLSSLCILNDEKEFRYFHTSYVTVDSVNFGKRSEANVSVDSKSSADKTEQTTGKAKSTHVHMHSKRDFRSRRPNTSRPPSVHVDEFERKNETNLSSPPSSSSSQLQQQTQQSQNRTTAPSVSSVGKQSKTNFQIETNGQDVGNRSSREEKSTLSLGSSSSIHDSSSPTTKPSTLSSKKILCSASVLSKIEELGKKTEELAVFLGKHPQLLDIMIKKQQERI